MTAIGPVLDRIDADLDGSLDRLFALLRLPSIATDPAYAKASADTAQHIADDLTSIGFKAEARPTAGQPIVVGHWTGAPAGAPHVLFYGHYDVQPVDPLSLWATDPFEPRIVEGPDGAKKIVARGACDDKGQLMTFVEACRAWMTTTGSLPVNITMLIEGEEESGSKNLPPFIKSNAAELKADVALVCDTGMWDKTTPAITTQLRGMVYEEFTVHAADRDLHSGLFGGAARNPIHVISKIIAAIHDEDGRITIPGFYEGVEELPADVKASWEKLNLTTDEFLGQIGLSVSAGEKGRLLIEQVSSRPTCDVNGVWGGYTGEGSKTVISAEASAKISFRLVGKQDPNKVRAAFRAFVEAHLPSDCRVSFISHSGAPAISLDWNLPILAKAKDVLTEEWQKEAVLIGSGGSIPVASDFKNTLGMDTLLIGFGLDDDRVHSPNEKYELSSFHKGARSWARILGALAR